MKINPDNLKILLLPQKKYPFSHSMMDAVFGKIFPEKGVKVIWFTQEKGNRIYIKKKEEKNGLFYILSFYSSRIKIIEWFLSLSRGMFFNFYMLKIIYAEKPDIVQVRNLVSPIIFLLLFRKLLKIRIVYQFSFPILEALKKACDEKRVSLPKLKKIFVIINIWIRDFFIKKVDLVLAISEEMKEWLTKRGINNRKIRSFPLGADLDYKVNKTKVAEIKKKYCLNGKRILLYFGVIEPNRELSFLIKVAKFICRKFNNVVFMLVGGDPIGGEIEKLKNLAEKNGLDENFIFTNHVKREDIPSYIYISEFTLSPIPEIPIYWISSPTKTIESLACGRAVVATRIPDQEKTIIRSNGGLLSEYNVDDFAGKIESLLSNPEKANEMGRIGQEYIKKKRNYKTLSKNLLNYYNEILENI